MTTTPPPGRADETEAHVEIKWRHNSKAWGTGIIGARDEEKIGRLTGESPRVSVFTNTLCNPSCESDSALSRSVSEPETVLDRSMSSTVLVGEMSGGICQPALLSGYSKSRQPCSMAWSPAALRTSFLGGLAWQLKWCRGPACCSGKTSEGNPFVLR